MKEESSGTNVPCEGECTCDVRYNVLVVYLHSALVRLLVDIR